MEQSSTLSTTDLLMGPYGLVFRILLNAEDLIGIAKINKLGRLSLPHIIGLLSMMEFVIDSARSIVPPEAVKQPGHKIELEKRLNQLRKQIGELASQVPRDDLSAALSEFGESIKINFLHNSKDS